MTEIVAPVPVVGQAEAGVVVSGDGTAPARVADGGLIIGPYRVTPVGLVITCRPTWDDAEAMAVALAAVDTGLMWCWGDFLVNSEATFGEAHAQLVGAGGEQLTAGSASVAKHVAARFPILNRFKTLGFKHHLTVAKLPTEEAQAWLTVAAENGWTVAQLRAEVKKAEQVARLTAALEVPALDAALYHGDAIDWLSMQPDASADLVLTDPPYGVGLAEWDDLTYDDVHSLNTEWVREAVRVVKTGGSIIVCGGQHSIFSAAHALLSAGMCYVAEIIWTKPFVERTSPHKLVPAHQNIVWVSKGEAYTYNNPEIERDVWSIPGDRAHGHPAEKPEVLIEKLIGIASNPGDLILDPFMGSGTVPAVARRLRRRYGGSERDDGWFAIANARVLGGADGDA